MDVKVQPGTAPQRWWNLPVPMWLVLLPVTAAMIVMVKAVQKPVESKLFLDIVPVYPVFWLWGSLRYRRGRKPWLFIIYVVSTVFIYATAVEEFYFRSAARCGNSFDHVFLFVVIPALVMIITLLGRGVRRLATVSKTVLEQNTCR